MVCEIRPSLGAFFSAPAGACFSPSLFFAEGARSTKMVSAGGAASVVPLDRSLILIAPGKNSIICSKDAKINAIRRYLRGKGSLAAPQTREHQFTT